MTNEAHEGKLVIAGIKKAGEGDFDEGWTIVSPRRQVFMLRDTFNIIAAYVAELEAERDRAYAKGLEDAVKIADHETAKLFRLIPQEGE